MNIFMATLCVREGLILKPLFWWAEMCLANLASRLLGVYGTGTQVRILPALLYEFSKIKVLMYPNSVTLKIKPVMTVGIIVIWKVALWIFKEYQKQIILIFWIADSRSVLLLFEKELKIRPSGVKGE